MFLNWIFLIIKLFVIIQGYEQIDAALGRWNFVFFAHEDVLKILLKENKKWKLFGSSQFYPYLCTIFESTNKIYHIFLVQNKATRVL